MVKPKGQEGSLRTSEEAQRQAQRNQALQEKFMGPIGGFGQTLMALGVDPNMFMASPLGQALLGIQRQGISGEFQGARNALMENLGSSGLVGSGVGLGPLANLYSQEALANANAFQQVPLAGLQLSGMGADILRGQQEIFNPNIARGQAIQGFVNTPRGGFGETFSQALGASLGSLPGKAAEFFMPKKP